MQSPKERILYLPLKKEWYEMIESGVKTEEYREIKEYWIKRLTSLNFPFLLFSYRNGYEAIPFKPFDCVKFSYGYTKRTMSFKIKSIEKGLGKKEWGAPDEDVFIIKLGERL